MSKQAIVTVSDASPALRSAVEMWIATSTDAESARRADLIRDKQNALIGTSGKARGFFAYCSLPADHVTASDVQDWRLHLEAAGLAPASVYARISRLSAFYKWLMKQPVFREHITSNPVLLARPKAPKAYQSERTQALSDDDARALLKTVKNAAKSGDLAALRDYALLRFYFATGKRRAEIIRLKWGDLKVNGVIVLTALHKGGIYQSTEITDPGVKAALFAYLKATGRWNEQADQPDLQPDSPLWLRHDRAANKAQADGKKLALTSHGFVKALKAYAEAAGIGDIHLHQTRHTAARMIGEASGNMSDVQTLLGHAAQRTTKVYLQRIAVKKDKYSAAIASRLGLDEEES